MAQLTDHPHRVRRGNDHVEIHLAALAANELARLPLANPFSLVPPAPTTAVNFAPPLANVYLVRVQGTKKGYLSLAEVQVIAPYTGVTINVTQPPASTTAVESRTATFGPVATSDDTSTMGRPVPSMVLTVV